MLGSKDGKLESVSESEKRDVLVKMECRVDSLPFSDWVECREHKQCDAMLVAMLKNLNSTKLLLKQLGEHRPKVN